MNRREHGFTLVELMVVVLVIGILVAIAVPVYKAARSTAEKNTCQSFQRTWAGVVQQARVNGDEPDAATAGNKQLDVDSDWDAVAAAYLKRVPVCPTSDTAYWVKQTASGDADNGTLVGCAGAESPAWTDGHMLASAGSAAAGGGAAPGGIWTPIDADTWQDGYGNTWTLVDADTWQDGSGNTYNVITTADGHQWLDRNLGATSNNPASSASYGWYFQWGRGADGHQLPTSGTTVDLSAGDSPGHSLFIATTNDWRGSRNDNLWQGVDGINNPCPPGFRLGTQSEWASLTAADLTALKLPFAGQRRDSDWYDDPSWKDYWTSDLVPPGNQYMPEGAVAAAIDASAPGQCSYEWAPRFIGLPVRAIKDH